jgi:hypothetical protein
MLKQIPRHLWSAVALKISRNCGDDLSAFGDLGDDGRGTLGALASLHRDRRARDRSGRRTDQFRLDLKTPPTKSKAAVSILSAAALLASSTHSGQAQLEVGL